MTRNNGLKKSEESSRSPVNRDARLCVKGRKGLRVGLCGLCRIVCRRWRPVTLLHLKFERPTVTFPDDLSIRGVFAHFVG